ncbi:hypothetical protein PIB30_090472 [Stylosanthes scabra]|uniref:Uncharacterized protein n=1 Tax=Stylosanthes scabra TaxID=79078 RepID=A0ABU6RUQ4_9FABA|nr:hypothetical protein [Stylosanthes scabra]
MWESELKIPSPRICIKNLMELRTFVIVGKVLTSNVVHIHRITSAEKIQSYGKVFMILDIFCSIAGSMPNKGKFGIGEFLLIFQMWIEKIEIMAKSENIMADWWPLEVISK